MDIYCRICGEPWDIDSLHEEAEARSVSFDTVKRLFLSEGCNALVNAFGPQRSCQPTDQPDPRAEAFSVLAELGDLDGAAAEVEDLLG